MQALELKHTPDDAKRIIEALENLATSHEKVDRNTEAVKLRAEIEALKAKQ